MKKKLDAVLVVVGVIALHLAMLWMMSLAARPRALRPDRVVAAPIAVQLIDPITSTSNPQPPPPPSSGMAGPKRQASASSWKSAAPSLQTARPYPDAPPALKGDAKSPLTTTAPPAEHTPSAGSDIPQLRLDIPKKTWQSFGSTGGPSANDAAIQIDAEALRAQKEGLSQGMESAGRDDCMKGKFKGSGMGLLSLPGLALSGLNGRCR